MPITYIESPNKKASIIVRENRLSTMPEARLESTHLRFAASKDTCSQQNKKVRSKK